MQQQRRQQLGQTQQGPPAERLNPDAQPFRPSSPPPSQIIPAPEPPVPSATADSGVSSTGAEAAMQISADRILTVSHVSPAPSSPASSTFSPAAKRQDTRGWREGLERMSERAERRQLAGAHALATLQRAVEAGRSGGVRRWWEEKSTADSEATGAPPAATGGVLV